MFVSFFFSPPPPTTTTKTKFRCLLLFQTVKILPIGRSAPRIRLWACGRATEHHDLVCPLAAPPPVNRSRASPAVQCARARVGGAPFGSPARKCSCPSALWRCGAPLSLMCPSKGDLVPCAALSTRGTASKRVLRCTCTRTGLGTIYVGPPRRKAAAAAVVAVFHRQRRATASHAADISQQGRPPRGEQGCGMAWDANRISQGDAPPRVEPRAATAPLRGAPVWSGVCRAP